MMRTTKGAARPPQRPKRRQSARHKRSAAGTAAGLRPSCTGTTGDMLAQLSLGLGSVRMGADDRTYFGAGVTAEESPSMLIA
mmetsp:Transcript_70725/g.212708  ORF Transcript_70725/g.212708 Transcript_70725/m.212708 type:complete len:82 (+) Transcript_70725:286-531(+)